MNFDRTVKVSTAHILEWICSTTQTVDQTLYLGQAPLLDLAARLLSFGSNSVEVALLSLWSQETFVVRISRLGYLKAGYQTRHRLSKSIVSYGCFGA
jgi:hypothetical protein